jgi:hypothetical protein
LGSSSVKVDRYGKAGTLVNAILLTSGRANVGLGCDGFDCRHLHNRKAPSTRVYVVHKAPHDAVVTRRDASMPVTRGLALGVSEISGE